MEKKEQKEKKIDEKESLRYSEACIDHRRKLIMPELDEELRKVPCISGRTCYSKGCPIFKSGYEENEKLNKEEKISKIKEAGFKEVTQEWLDEKPKKKEKKISREVEEFLYLQSRVIGKLSWNPQIWQALDKLSVQEILDRLLGKTGLEGVATHVGGDMQLKASPKTKKLFENLEKQYAEEDEAKGKSPPPDYESYGKQEPEPWFEIIDKTVKVNVVPKDVPPQWAEKKEEKKNVKKIDKK